MESFFIAALGVASMVLVVGGALRSLELERHDYHPHRTPHAWHGHH